MALRNFLLYGLACPASFLLWLATPAYSAQAEYLDKIGDWSLVCTKTEEQRKPTDCSIATAAVALQTGDHIREKWWVKVAFAFRSKAGDAEMTIRVPQVKRLREGIGIAANKRPLGKA